MYNLIKRLFEVFLTSIFIVILSPVILLIIILVRLESKGPVFLKYKKVGKNMREFYIYRIRTMFLDRNKSEQLTFFGQILHNRFKNEDTNISKRLKLDPRVTKIGRLLRITNLDELPKFINVIKGDMNLIGPRPINPFELQYLNESQKKVFEVEPGLISLSIVEDKYSFDEQLEADIKYVKEYNLLLDMKILLKSLIKTFKLMKT